MDIQAAKTDLMRVAASGGSTAEQGINQEDGSVLVLRSVQGDPCEEFVFSAEDREANGWPAPVEEE